MTLDPKGQFTAEVLCRLACLVSIKYWCTHQYPEIIQIILTLHFCLNTVDVRKSSVHHVKVHTQTILSLVIPQKATDSSGSTSAAVHITRAADYLATMCQADLDLA